MQPGLVRAVCLSMLMVWSSRAFALNPALEINQYAHAAWTIREGFFNNAVFSIAQTPDGYLWLATDFGLLRFDGVRAVVWQPSSGQHIPSQTVHKLLAARDGRLWLGTARGLASWKAGTLVVYPELAGQDVIAVAEDDAGDVWAGTATIPGSRLCAFGRAVRCFGQDGRFGSGVFSLFAEGANVWVGAATGLWRWTQDDGHRFDMPSPSLSDVVRLSDGALLLAMTGGIRQFVADKLQSYSVVGLDEKGTAARLLVDRDGGLWIGTSGHGLLHAYQGRVDRFTQADGLSGDSIGALFEDREGNVWVATYEGIDRFRENPIMTAPRGTGWAADVVSSVLRGRDDSVWLGTSDGLIHWKDGRTTR